MDLSPDDWIAIELSLRIALVATLGGLPFAVAIAWVLARKRFPGRLALDALVHLPLVLPPVVTGFVLLALLGRRGPLGIVLHDWFGITLAFRWTGAAVAGAIMSFPLMVRPIRLAFEGIDPKLERAAGSLGANAIWRFALVTLPLALPGVLVGALLGFAKALGEFGATITFVSNIPGETRTIAAAIWTYVQSPDGDAPAMRLAIVSAIIAVAALGLSEWLARRWTRREAL